MYYNRILEQTIIKTSKTFPVTNVIFLTKASYVLHPCAKSEKSTTYKSENSGSYSLFRDRTTSGWKDDAAYKDGGRKQNDCVFG